MSSECSCRALLLCTLLPSVNVHTHSGLSNTVLRFTVLAWLLSLFLYGVPSSQRSDFWELQYCTRVLVIVFNIQLYAVAQLSSAQAASVHGASLAHSVSHSILHHENMLTGDFVASRFRCHHAKRVLIKVGTRVATRAQDERLAIGRLGAS